MGLSRLLNSLQAMISQLAGLGETQRCSVWAGCTSAADSVQAELARLPGQHMALWSATHSGLCRQETVEGATGLQAPYSRSAHCT